MSSHQNNQSAPDINTGYPGHIYNFDPITQTCEVQLAIENLFVGHEKGYTLETKQRLIGVPVQFIQGGGWFLTHPVPDETPCYVHFAQRGVEHFIYDNASEAGMTNGKPNAPFGQLYSHLAAFAVIGLQPIPKAIPNFTSAVFEMRNAARDMRVSLFDNGAVIIMSGTAFVRVDKNGQISLTSPTQITARAPKIVLDGDTTVTKSLTVQGGMAVSGVSGGQTMSITGNVKYSGNVDHATGNFTLGGIVVNTHKHSNPEGGDVGPMK